MFRTRQDGHCYDHQTENRSSDMFFHGGGSFMLFNGNSELSQFVCKHSRKLFSMQRFHISPYL